MAAALASPLRRLAGVRTRPLRRLEALISADHAEIIGPGPRKRAAAVSSLPSA